MREENVELLEDVVKVKLTDVKNGNYQENDNTFREAMDAVDRQLAYDKYLADAASASVKIEYEEKNKKKDRWVRIGELTVASLAAPMLKFVFEKSHIKDVCNFEKTYTFTTSAAKGLLKEIFRFK